MTIDKNTTVGDIMTRNVTTVEYNASLIEVDAIFEKQNIHHLPVVRDGEVVGMISEGDILIMKDWGTKLGLKSSLLSNREIFQSHTAEELMSKAVISVKEDYSLRQLIDLMKTNRYRAFPVLDYGKLIGIVTSYDVIHKAIKL